MPPQAIHEAVRVDLATVSIDGDLRVPPRAAGLVIFAHGSGSSRFSRRNIAVAGALEAAGFGTLLLGLLTSAEEAVDERTAEYCFDIELLATRVAGATDWVQDHSDLHDLPVGYFGASTGAAAALIAAAARPEIVRAVANIFSRSRARLSRSRVLRPTGSSDISSVGRAYNPYPLPPTP